MPNTFTNQQIAVARETQLFVGLETAAGTQVVPGACNLVLLNAAGSVAQNINRIPDPQFRNTRSRLLPVAGSFGEGKFTFPCSIKMSPGAGAPVAPELDVLYQCTFGLPATTNNTQFGTTPHRAYQLLGVTAGGTRYPSFTGYFKTSHTVYYFTGATVNEAEFMVQGNELGKVTFNGGFMRMGWAGTDVAMTAGSSSASLVVQDASKYFIANSADRIYIQVVDPVTFAPVAGFASGVAVSAVNYTTNTLTLATAQTWPQYAFVVPYLPVGSEVGVQIYGKYGLVRLAGFVDETFANLPAATQVIQSSKITITNGIKYHIDVKDGTSYPIDYVAPAAREVKGELTLYQYRNLPSFAYKSQLDPLLPDYVIIPLQDQNATPGKIMQFHLPNITYETPTYAGEDEKIATIPFMATAAAGAYDTELSMVIYGS